MSSVDGWNNSPNSPSRKVKVTVTFTHNTLPDKVISDEKVVVVKHIAPIVSMTVSGASPSMINSTGGGISVPCGISTFTVSVPIPVTSPTQAITYDWGLPSGWTGSSTSNTISVTSNAGGGGPILVTANRTDGTTLRQFLVNVTRPTVGTASISGTNPRIVCDNETEIFTANASNATNYTWQVGGDVSIIGSNTSSSVSVQNSGIGTLEITADNTCQTPKTKIVDIYSGPEYQSATVNGSPSQSLNYITNPALLKVFTNSTASSYTWSIASGTGSIYPNFAECTAYAYPFVQVKVTGTNECGTNNLYFFYLQDSSSGGYYRMNSSNPAKDNISIEFKQEVAQKYLKSVKLVDERRGAIVQDFDVNAAKSTGFFDRNNRLDLDVAKLPKGPYYLVLTFVNDLSFQELIILN